MISGEVTRQGLDVAAPLSELCPLPVGAGENFPAKIELTHSLPRGPAPGGYEDALRQSTVGLRISYVATKRRFLIGPTSFEPDFLVGLKRSRGY
jgi:hypothetical protein